MRARAKNAATTPIPVQLSATDFHKFISLMLDSRVLRDQKLNKRVKQRFASLSDVVHKLKTTQVKRELLL
jgi:hypothetical protein